MTTPRSSHFDVGLREVAAGISVRPLRAGDRPQIEKLLRTSHNFTAEEVETALEIIDETLGGDPEYLVNVLETESAVVGYECHGPAPLTEGTFDLYWIVVDATAQKR